MCKGDELDAFIEKHGDWDGWDEVIYLGDGENDFCPLLRMREKDLAMVRKGMSLERRVKSEGGLKCGLRYWTGAWEVDEWVTDLGCGL